MAGTYIKQNAPYWTSQSAFRSANSTNKSSMLSSSSNKSGASSSNPSKSTAAQTTPRSFSPYQDALAIQGYKRGYMNAKDSGDMPSAYNYENLAKANYDNLRKNGYGGLAARLETADLGNTSSIMDELAFANYQNQYKTAQADAIDSNLQNQILDLTQQKNNVNSDYNNQARAAYINYLQNQKKLPQQLKASGITGGLSETSRIALANSYGEQLSESERNRLSALQDIDTEISRAKNDANTQKANLNTQLASEYFQQLINRSNQDYQSEEARKDRGQQTALQTLSQNWQSGENAQDRALQADLQESSQNWQSGENAQDRNLTVSEAEKDRQMQNEQQAWERAQAAASYGNFSLLAQLLGTDEQTARNAYIQFLQDTTNAQNTTSTIRHVSSNSAAAPQSSNAGAVSSGTQSAATSSASDIDAYWGR